MKRFFVLLFLIIICHLGFAQTKVFNMANTLEDMYSWNKYPTYSTYIDFMHYYADTYPNLCVLDTIGSTNEGRLLLALKICNNATQEQSKPKFFYTSSMHGDELTGAIIMMRLIDTLLSHSENFVSLLNSIQLYINPFANPDGTWYSDNNSVLSAKRYNANMVDINRNFPDVRFGGNTDGEVIQAETQAFMHYALINRFNMSCNLHGGSEVFNYPYDCFPSSAKRHTDSNWFKALGEDFISDLGGRTKGYFTDISNSGIIDGGDWYTVYGGRQDWHTYYAHCREVTLEVSLDKMPSSNDLPIFWSYLKKSLFVFLNYSKKGFEGLVVDSNTTEPLQDVMVEIDNHDIDSSQVFTNKIGYYFRPILSGIYSVTFSKNGYYSKTIEITSGDNLTDYNVQLIPTGTFIHDTRDMALQIYPLPFKESLTIFADEYLTYQIIDLQGIKVKEGKLLQGTNILNTQNLSPNTYIIKMYNLQGKAISKKLIKQK